MITVLAWIGAAYLAATAGLVAIGVIVSIRWRPRGSDMEALINATREEHPQYRDWDTREITR